MQRAVFVAGSAAVIALIIAVRRTTPANAEPAVTGSRASLFSLGDARKLRAELETARGELTLARA